MNASHPLPFPLPEPAALEPHAPPDPKLGPREVPIDWDALIDAFGNTVPDVHQFLSFATGDVLRIDGSTADTGKLAAIEADRAYLPIAPVHPAHQYRWMKEYTATLDDPPLVARLIEAMQGKGAFRRFKDALVDRERERNGWFSFRKDRLRSAIEAWLADRGLVAAAPPPSPPLPAPRPRPAEIAPAPHEASASGPPPRALVTMGPQAALVTMGPDALRSLEHTRARVQEIATSLGPRDLYALAAMAEFLRSRSVD